MAGGNGMPLRRPRQQFIQDPRNHGYDHFGFDEIGRDEDGFDRRGLDRDGYDRTGEDVNGYYRDGMNARGELPPEARAPPLGQQPQPRDEWDERIRRHNDGGAFGHNPPTPRPYPEEHARLLPHRRAEHERYTRFSERPRGVDVGRHDGMPYETRFYPRNRDPRMNGVGGGGGGDPAWPRGSNTFEKPARRRRQEERRNGRSPSSPADGSATSTSATPPSRSAARGKEP